MNAQPISEFRLSPPGSNRGISCDANGAFVGSIPLLKRARMNGREVWQPRDCGQLSKQVSASYGVPIDMASKMGGLHAISRALSEGDIARAQIATVLLAIPEPPPLSKGVRPRSDMIKFIRDLYWSGLIKWNDDEHVWQSSGPAIASNVAVPPRDESALVKAGFNPNEPRDERGRWTDGGDSSSAVGSNSSNAFLQYGAQEGKLDDGVYHPDGDPAELDPTASSPEQLKLNRLLHDAQVRREMEAWWKRGFVPIPNVTFEDPRTGAQIIADYVVSAWVPDPETLFLPTKLEPILVRDVKTGGGGLTDNQKEVYPHIKAGGEVIPVGDNAAFAGFEVGVPTVIVELYVGPDGPSFTVH